MNFTLRATALAILVAITQPAGMAYAQAPNTPAVVVPPDPAENKTPIPIKSPEYWIVYDHTTYTPVIDDVSRHLNTARKAFDAKDNKQAAVEMRAVADELKQQAVQADYEYKVLDMAASKHGRDAIKRINASALKISAAAAAIESGKIQTKAELDKVIDKATRADMDQRWLVADVDTWYPVNEEPQHQFTDAVAAYAKKDYTTAAVDIRKANSYLRLEAVRASGNAKQELDSSIAQLDTLAAAAEKGSMKDEQSMAKVFAKADHALALEHRSKASESWSRKEYDKAGYELKAAAYGLESAAGWTGGEAMEAASTTVADTRALGDKLTTAAKWTRDEVAKGFDSLGKSINALGHKIGITKMALPVDVYENKISGAQG